MSTKRLQVFGAIATQDYVDAKVKEAASIQSDYERGGSYSPDFIKNRPFHDAYDSLILAQTLSFTVNDGAGSVNVTLANDAPVLEAGKTYTICTNDMSYTGEAVDMTTVLNYGYPVIAFGNLSMLGVDKGTETSVVVMFSNLSALPDSETDNMISIAFNGESAAFDRWCAIAEGTKIPNAVSVENDLISIPKSGYSHVSNALPQETDMANGIAINYTNTEGEEAAWSATDLTQEGDSTSQIVFKSNGVEVAAIVYVASDDLPAGVYLVNNSENWEVQSFQINNYSGFAEKYDLKKIPDRFIPDSVLMKGEITETTTSNEIVWDGVVGDTELDGLLIRVSEYVPDIYDFAQGFTVTAIVGGVEMSQDESADSIVLVSENIYVLGSNPYVMVALTDGATFEEDGEEVVISKKGTYFMYSYVLDEHYIRSLSSPLLSVPTVQVKESAIPESIARLADIPKHLVQTNYTENDPTSPAYMQNRPFHDAWESAVCAGVLLKYDTADGGYMHDEAKAEKLRRSFETGKTYTILINETAYTGIANVGSHVSFPGIDVISLANPDGAIVSILDVIGAGQGEENFVLFEPTVLSAMALEAKDYPFIIYEGNVPPDTVRPEDATESYMYGLLMRVSTNAFSEDDLANGCELRMITQDGTEVVLGKDELVFQADVPTAGMAMCAPQDDADAFAVVAISAGGVNIDGVGYIPEGTYFLIDTSMAVNYAGIVSFRIPYSLIFSKQLPLKKLPEKFLPGPVILYMNETDEYLYKSGDTSNAENRMTRAELIAVINSGRNPIVCLEAGAADESEAGIVVYGFMLSVYFTPEFGAALYAMTDSQLARYTAEYTTT